MVSSRFRATLAAVVHAASSAGSRAGSAGDSPVPQDKPVVYRGARIHTAAGAPIEKGMLIVHKGKIVAAGAEGSVTVPDGAVSVNLEGRPSPDRRQWHRR